MSNRFSILEYTKQADSVLLAKPESMRAFSQFTGEGYILCGKDKKVFLITDSRYEIQAHEQTDDIDVFIVSVEKNHFDFINELIIKNGYHSVAFEDEYWSVCDFDRLESLNRDTIFVPLGSALTKWRMIKTNEEISKIRKAAEIADEAFKDALCFLKQGISEREAAWKLEQSMRNHGADGLSFSTIMAFGENGAKPHAIPGDRTLKTGDMIVMDYGCILDGYCSDMTRTIGFGSVSEKAVKVYNIVLEAQLAALEQIKPGKTGEEIDTVARDIIASYGFGAYFGHGLGHGVGLEIHELPRLTQGPSGKIVLEPGHVITDEPGIYLPEEFGVRIEDLCLVTQMGVETLSHSPKEFITISNA